MSPMGGACFTRPVFFRRVVTPQEPAHKMRWSSSARETRRFARNTPHEKRRLNQFSLKDLLADAAEIRQGGIVGCDQ